MLKKFFCKMGVVLLTASLILNVMYIPISAEECRKEYRYHRYIDDNGNVSLCPYYGNWKYNTSNMQIEYTDWLDAPLQVDNGKYSCYSHVYQGKSCDKAGCIDSSTETNRYIDKDGSYWFYEEVKSVQENSTGEKDETGTNLLYVENSVWNEIGIGVLEYAIDVFAGITDSLSPSEKLDVTKALLSNKELIKNLLNISVLHELEDEDLLNELFEIMENNGDSDTVSEEAANFLYIAAHKKPELRDHIIFTLIKYSPRLVMEVATSACGKSIPALNMFLNVFEVSSERFWNLGEAIADYIDAYGELEDSFTARFEDLLLADIRFTNDVMVIAFQDKEEGKLSHVNEIEMMENTMYGIRDDICNRINGTLTIWFRILHPQITERLERISDKLDKVEFDYMSYYLEIVNK